MHNLFVYGTLRHRDCLERVIGHPHRSVIYSQAILPGYERWVRGVAFITPKVGSVVSGHLIMGLSEADLRRLDRYESVAAGLYRRVDVTVTYYMFGELRSIAAYVYAAGERSTAFHNYAAGVLGLVPDEQEPWLSAT